jgi:Ras family
MQRQRLRQEAAQAEKRPAAEVIVKLVLVGGPQVGKSAIVRRLLDKSFRETYDATAAFDVTFLPYGTHRGGAPLLLELWDVAGAQLTAVPSHHALIASDAAAVMYVLNVSDSTSLHAVDHWRAALTPYLPDSAVSWLVAHKLDLPGYVVERSALDAFVAAAGFRDWCCTVGGAQFGDYSVGGKRGKKRSGDAARRALAAKQLSVPEAVQRVVDAALKQRDSSDSPTTVSTNTTGTESDVSTVMFLIACMSSSIWLAKCIAVSVLYVTAAS